MLAALQDAHGIHKPVAALLRDNEGQILIILQHGQVIAGIVHGHGSIAALHLLEHLIHNEGLIHTIVLGLLQQGESLLQLALVGGIDAVSQIQQGRRQSVTGVVDHQHLSGVLGVEHGAPAGDGLRDHGGVVDNTQCTPGVGDGVLVLRVVAEVLIGIGNEVKVGDVAVIQLRQHILVNEPGDHIVRGDDDIEVGASHFDEGVQSLVALRRLVVDPDAGLLLKLGDETLVDILAPGAHVHHPVGPGGAAGDNQRHHQHAGRQSRPHTAQGLMELAAVGVGGRWGGVVLRLQAVVGTALPQVHDGQQHQHRHEQQGGDGVDLRADPLLGHAVDGHGQRGGAGTGGEVADDEVIHRHGEGRQSAGDDTGLDLRDHHTPEGLHPRAAQILRRIDEVAVHLPQLGPHGQNHIGDIEADMGDQQCAEAHGQALRQHHQRLPRIHPPGESAPAVEEHHEQQAQADAGDDIRIHHGDVVDGVHRRTTAAAHGVQADGGEGAGDGRHDGGQQRHQQRGIDAVHNEPVGEKGLVPLQGEALPHAGAGTGVEGKDDQDDDGCIEKQEHQRHQQPVAKAILGAAHSFTACSSPSPKRFITSIHTSTMIIITSEMAAPSWGL